MATRPALPAVLALAAVALHGCGGPDAVTTTSAPASTTTPAAVTTTKTGPVKPANTWCAAAPRGASASDLKEPGPSIGWKPTDQVVGKGEWCEVGVPAADWHLSDYCARSQVVAREGFAMERFLSAAVAAPAATAPAAPARIKVLTYNLYWWHLFNIEKGRDGAAGKNIANYSQSEPFDLIGFQECEDVDWPLRDAKAAGMQGEFATFQKEDAVCLAYRKEAFHVLGWGEGAVAEDGAAQHFGKRIVLWVRLLHKASQRPIFFMNHHGPTPVNSGGVCGPAATAYQILRVIAINAEIGDAVILAGDFNAWSNDPSGKWLEEIGRLDCHIPHVFSNPTIDDVWGIDNVFASCLNPVETHVMPKGGSDHNALAVVFEA